MIFRQFRRRLMVSAMARNLAVDLVARHGGAAMQRLETMIEQGGDDVDRMDILVKAREEMRKLMPCQVALRE